MNKNDFLESLSNRLSGLPQEDIVERLTFYSELIDDSIEEGMTEQDAVARIGSVDEIVSQIIADIPNSKYVIRAQITKRKLAVWEIVLLVLGSPIWISLLVSAFAVIFALYISLWSLIVSLWAVFASVFGTVFGVIISGVAFVIRGNSLSGIAMIGVGLFCFGFGILLFYACKLATNGVITFTKAIFKKIKSRFSKKEKIK